MIVYKTTNLINGKFYVGKDTHDNPKYLGSGKLLNLAIAKYGRDNFKKEILERCSSIDVLNEAEKKWIEILNATTSYNIAKGGTGGDTLTHHPDIEKIKQKQKGRMAWNKGQKRPDIAGELNPSNRPEVKAKISAAKKGVLRPDILGELNPSNRPEVKEKISLKLKGKPKPRIQCPHCGLEGQIPNMNRWHFNNCKMKKYD